MRDPFHGYAASLAALLLVAGHCTASGQAPPPGRAARDEAAARVAIEALTVEYSYLPDKRSMSASCLYIKPLIGNRAVSLRQAAGHSAVIITQKQERILINALKV
tara:strand:+ start:1217 stop:1531 length:315 start_codon:yes stop_codon:yes gene_type:complete